MDNNQPKALNTYWMQQVAAWKSSGMSQASFCKTHDLVYHRFIYWKLKLEGTSPRSALSPCKKSEFVKVLPDTLTSVRQDSGLTLSLPNGMTLKGLSDANINLACQLIERLP